MTDPLPSRTPTAGYIAQSPTFSDHLRLVVAPPRDEDVLVADEIVYYRAPKHGMSLAEPFVETLAVLVVVSALLARPSFTGPNLSALLIVLAAIIVVRWVREQDWGWSALISGVVVSYVMLTNQIDPIVLLPGVGLWFLARFSLRILRWWKYEILYLTNRRIIEATGFLGLRVASMPVTRVTDLVLDRTTFGEIFGYGDLRIESAGQDQSLANVHFLVEPRTFHRLAVRLATKPAEIDLKAFIDVDPTRQIGK